MAHLSIKPHMSTRSGGCGDVTFSLGVGEVKSSFVCLHVVPPTRKAHFVVAVVKVLCQNELRRQNATP